MRTITESEFYEAMRQLELLSAREPGFLGADVSVLVEPWMRSRTAPVPYDSLSKKVKDALDRACSSTKAAQSIG